MAVLAGGVIEDSSLDNSSESEVSTEYIREAPFNEVRARMYAEREEKLNRLASGQGETEESEEATSEDESTETGSEDESQEAETASTQEGASEVAAEETLEVQFRKAQERFNSLSANTKALSDQNRELKRQLADFQRQQEQSAEQQQMALRQQEYDAITAYVQTLRPEHREEAMEYYRRKVKESEWGEYQKYLASQAETIESRQQELDLREVRAALPEVVDTMFTQIAAHDEVPVELFREVAKTPVFQGLLANYMEQRDLLLIGQTLRAVGLVEKQRLSSRKAENRQAATTQQVHRRVNGTGTGNNLTANERLAQIPKGEAWQEFRRQVKLHGLEKALTQQGQ